MTEMIGCLNTALSNRLGVPSVRRNIARFAEAISNFLKHDLRVAMIMEIDAEFIWAVFLATGADIGTLQHPHRSVSFSGIAVHQSQLPIKERSLKDRYKGEAASEPLKAVRVAGHARCFERNNTVDISLVAAFAFLLFGLALTGARVNPGIWWTTAVDGLRP